MIVTRWNPSQNGAIHLGHVYCLMVNEYFAHHYGGKFHIRFDDNSPNILKLSQERLKNIILGQTDDVNWLEIPVDSWSMQSSLLPEVTERLNKLGWKHYKDIESCYLPVNIRLGMSFMYYPYVPQQIAERVIMDNMIGVTHVIRGEDFPTEYSLYCWFCDMFGLPIPEFYYIPRLMGRKGDISKTNGGYIIKELRGQGYSPNDIKRLLGKACLYYPENGWDFINLRSEPRIDL